MHKHLCRLRDCPKVIHRCFFVFRKNAKKIFWGLNPKIGGHDESYSERNAAQGGKARLYRRGGRRRLTSRGEKDGKDICTIHSDKMTFKRGEDDTLLEQLIDIYHTVQEYTAAYEKAP